MRKISAAAGSLLMTVGVSAHAALPTEAANAFTTVSTNVTDIFAAVWPIVATVTGGFILVKLFKKGANKAV